MKRTLWYLFIVLTLSVTQLSCASLHNVEGNQTSHSEKLLKTIKAIPNVKKVNILKTCDHFTEHYEIWFEQKVDPSNPNSATFNQRVLIAHASMDAPVIVELQGYEIYSPRAGELAQLFIGNQITIEHRFFANSKPSGGIPWEHLTVRNAATDQHIIIEALKKAIYPENKFLSTGISKGGQTTMLHRSYYPDDVDVSVCYVAPLNFEREDPRIYHFFDTVGTEGQRVKIKDYQTLCLNRKAEMVKLLEDMGKKEGYEWDITVEKAFEMYVLEYSFAFWQWGEYEFDQIPDGEATSDSLLNHVLNVSGISFFEADGVEELRPYFWAALTEMGIYGYDYIPFKDQLSQQEVYTFDFTFPKGQQAPFDPVPMKTLNEFIQAEANTMMFIYGGLDTWSATAVQLSDEAKSRGLVKYVLPDGHHGTRIRDFNAKQQDAIKKTLELWMDAKIQ